MSSSKNIKDILPNNKGELDLNEYTMQKSLDKNLEIMDHIFSENDNLIKRMLQNQDNQKIKCAALFIDGMVNNDIVNEHIIKPVIINKNLAKSSKTLDVIGSQILFSNDVKKSQDFNEIVDSVLYGDTALFVDGCCGALIINSKGWQIRSIAEPDTEKALRGPHEGFTESILINTSLIRRKIKTSDLKFKFDTFGTRSNTKTCICYVDSLVDKKILKELYKRLEKINIDGILDSNYIAENIKDERLSLFKTVGVTERPDAVAAKLLEGRIAIIVDGSPDVLTVPYLFIENFQASDDYYINFYFSSVGRMLRIMGFLFTISVPSVYLALINFHKELIPTPLVVSIAQAHNGVPFPSIIECLLMLLIFEIIREAGMRMPSNIGQALSLVGALVIGQAAVEAKIISAPMVIIVAATAITGLINTRIKGASIIIRLVFIVFSSVIGLYGYFFALTGLLIHLLSMKSFGINYTSQMTSINLQDAKDIFIRAPWWFMKKRPKHMTKNIIRSKQDGDKSP